MSNAYDLANRFPIIHSNIGLNLGSQKNQTNKQQVKLPLVKRSFQKNKSFSKFQKGLSKVKSMDLLKSLSPGSQSEQSKLLNHPTKHTIHTIPTQTSQVENSLISNNIFLDQGTQIIGANTLSPTNLVDNQRNFFSQTQPKVHIQRYLSLCNKSHLDNLIEKNRADQIVTSKIKRNPDPDFDKKNNSSKTPSNKILEQKNYHKSPTFHREKIQLQNLYQTEYDMEDNDAPRKSYSQFKFNNARSQENVSILSKRTSQENSYLNPNLKYEIFKLLGVQTVTQLFDIAQMQRLKKLKKNPIQKGQTSEIEEIDFLKQKNRIQVLIEKNKSLSQMHSVSSKILKDIDKQNSKMVHILDKFTAELKTNIRSEDQTLFEEI